MALKTKYRREELGQLPEQPIEQPAEAPEAPAPVMDEPPAPTPEPLNAAQRAADDALALQPEQPQQSHQDDAALALKAQIDALKRSEQVQRQPMPQPGMSREARLAEWQAQGLSNAEVQFFQKHPEMIDHPQITGLAVHRALEAGLERGTPAHFNAVEKIFNANLHHAQPTPQPTPQPEFFKPPPAAPARNPSSLVSAPVSRGVPNSNGKRHSSPGKITLTPAQVEAARLSGISPAEYAKQLIEYERQRETGEYRDNRDQR